MATTTFQQSYSIEFNKSVTQVSLWSKFVSWCTNQEEHRLTWLAAAIAGHGCVLTPLTLLAVVFTGNNFVLYVLGIIAMAMCLITNLAALPTKITIPTFFLSIIIDIAIVATCFTLALQ